MVTFVFISVHDAIEANESTGGAGRSLLDEIVRDGARQMLAAALKAEVAAYVAQFADQLDEKGHRLVVRNGYHQAREVLTAAGAVEVKAPRVNDKRVDPDTGERKRFSSAILPAWARKSPQMSEVLPLLLPARAVHQRLHPRSGAVPGLGCRALGHHDHPADQPVAGRGPRVCRPGPVGHRLRLPVGRRHPPHGPPGPGKAVSAGDARRARGRPQRARGDHQRLTGNRPSRGLICCATVNDAA